MAKAQAKITIVDPHVADDLNRERSEALADLMRDIGVQVCLNDKKQFVVTCIDYPDVAVCGDAFQDVMTEASEYIHAAIVLDNPGIDVPSMDDTGFSADFTDEALEAAKPYMDEV